MRSRTLCNRPVAYEITATALVRASARTPLNMAALSFEQARAFAALGAEYTSGAWAFVAREFAHSALAWAPLLLAAAVSVDVTRRVLRAVLAYADFFASVLWVLTAPFLALLVVAYGAREGARRGILDPETAAAVEARATSPEAVAATSALFVTYAVAGALGVRGRAAPDK